MGSREGEGCALGIAADHPPVARMDDLAAESIHPRYGGSEVGDRKVRERKAVARARAALVQPDHDPLVLGLPAAPILWLTILQSCLQQLLPEVSCPLGIVGGKLDQKP